MPVLNCPHCGAVNALPDPWYAPGYTCHHCRQPVGILHPPAPKPEPFADLAERVDNGIPIRRRTRRPWRGGGEPHAHVLLILVGFLCAAASLFILPPAFGVAGLIFGGICVAQRSTVSGILIVILSGVCASVGMIWGIEAVLFGRPKSFGGDRLPFPAAQHPLFPDTSDPNKSDGPSEGPRAEAGKEMAKISGVSVSVTDVSLGKARWEEVFDRHGDTKDAIKVRLRVSTQDKTKKIDFRTWREQWNSPTLKDNFGNTYHGEYTGGATTLTVDGNRSYHTIVADTSGEDVLVFKKPLNTVQYLDLDLPGDAVGLKATDVFRFRVPREMWAGKK